MQLAKHVDGLAGLAAVSWAVLVTLLPALSVLGEHVSPGAAMVFAVVALGRWYAGVRRVAS